MVNAMAAIAILGFLVWAFPITILMGLFFCEKEGIKSLYMLGSSNTIQYLCNYGAIFLLIPGAICSSSFAPYFIKIKKSVWKGCFFRLNAKSYIGCLNHPFMNNQQETFNIWLKEKEMFYINRVILKKITIGINHFNININNCIRQNNPIIFMNLRFYGKKGSPETTREITQNVQHDYDYHFKTPTIDVWWFVGFYEADGCLTTTYHGKSPILSFVLRQADPKILHKARQFLGYGSQVYKDQEGYWALSVRCKEGLFKVLNMLNGRVFLQKRLVQLQESIQVYNKKNGTNIIPITTPAPFVLTNAWLTGFADADGSMNIQLIVRKHKVRPRLRLRFYLDQADCLDCLKKIQKVIGGTLEKRRNDKGVYHRLIIDTWNKTPAIVDYFTQYTPLTTTLFVRFIRYVRVYRWYMLKQWETRKDEIQHLILLNKRLKKKNQDEDST